MFEKLLILITSIFLITISAFSNIYPIYLNKFNEIFNLSIDKINFYPSFLAIGIYTGYPIGIIYDKYGPKISTLLGTFLLFIGYLFLAIKLSFESLKNSSFLSLIILSLIIGQGTSILNLSIMGTNLKNFRIKKNSSIITILLSIYVISPTIFTTYQDTLTLILLNNKIFYHIAFFILLIGLLCCMNMDNLPNSYREDKVLRKYQRYKEKKVINLLLLFNLLISIIYILGVNMNYNNDNYKFNLITFYTFMILSNLVFCILEQSGIFDSLFYSKFKSKIDSIAKFQMEMENMSSDYPISSNKESNNNINDSIIRSIRKMNEGGLYLSKEIHFHKIIKNPKYILLFIILALGLSIIFCNVENLNSLYISLGNNKLYNQINKGVISLYNVKELYYYYFLYFSSNLIMRLFSGKIIDTFIKKKVFVLYLILCALCGFISQILGLFLTKNTLYVSIVLEGITYGGFICFSLIFLEREFGINHYGKILGILLSGVGIGKLIINIILYSLPYYIYGKNNNFGTCYGKKCYTWRYVITSIIYVLIAFASLIVHLIILDEAKNKN